MARARRKQTGRKRSGWLSSRNLLLLEAVLLVGLGKEMLEQWVLEASQVPPLLRVVLGMVVVVGAFGGLLVVVQRQIERGLKSTQQAVQRLPLPTPQLAVHALALVLIFGAYAWFWDDQTGALGFLWGWASERATALVAGP